MAARQDNGTNLTTVVDQMKKLGIALCFLVLQSSLMASNLLKNGSFDRDLDGWSATTYPDKVVTTWDASNAWDGSGSGSARVRFKGPSQDNYAYNALSQNVPVQPGATYVLTATMKNLAYPESSSRRGTKVDVAFRDSAGTLLTSMYVERFRYPEQEPPWETLSVRATAPAGTVDARITIYSRANFGHETLVDDVEFDGPAKGATCAADATTLCLNNARFRVSARWRAPDGSSGIAKAVALTSDTGYFWFFAAENVEVFVKALDGCGVNGRYWIFGSGATNVEVKLDVTDTKTGFAHPYENPLGIAFLPIQDTGTFPCP